MSSMKITSWNVEYLDRLTKPNISNTARRRRDAVIEEIREISPDVLCLMEGPKGEAAIDLVSNNLLNGDWVAVKAPDGKYAIKGVQWIWFLVKKNLINQASLLPIGTWDAFAGNKWKIHYWGEHVEKNHSHWRHPQVLVFESDGLRVEFIGLHLKSMFINRGKTQWNKGGKTREKFIEKALSNRIKMTTEAANVREYIDAKFGQVEKPAIFVLGDFNDGPGKEHFEKHYLFLDIISNIQGEVFQSERYLNHALFDFPDNLKWTVKFKDYIDETRNPYILLDHILFTQGLVDGSLPWQANAHAGKVEHEIHDVINAELPKKAKTSDHKPISLTVAIN